MAKNNTPEEFFLRISGLQKHPTLNRPLLKNYAIDESIIMVKRWKRQRISTYKNWLQRRRRLSSEIQLGSKLC